MSSSTPSAARNAALGALCTLGLTTLATYQAANDWGDALVGGGVAFFSYILTRGLGEGSYDQRREGPPPQPQAGDVGRRP